MSQIFLSELDELSSGGNTGLDPFACIKFTDWKNNGICFTYRSCCSQGCFIKKSLVNTDLSQSQDDGQDLSILL